APDALARGLQGFRTFAERQGFADQVAPVLDNVRANASALAQKVAELLAPAAGRLASGVGQLLGLALLPVLAFYLLADADAVQSSVLRFVPETARPQLLRLEAAVDRALASYVRGQGTVCLVMGLTVGLALYLLHHPAALLLGVVVGFAELVPFVGF